jgi:hypothetical protein
MGVEITSKRKPLFLKKGKAKNSSGLFISKKILVSFSVLFVAVIAIVVVLLLGVSLKEEALQKSALLIPFFKKLK